MVLKYSLMMMMLSCLLFVPSHFSSDCHLDWLAGARLKNRGCTIEIPSYYGKKKKQKRKKNKKERWRLDETVGFSDSKNSFDTQSRPLDDKIV
jgi:hypothetical protein